MVALIRCAILVAVVFAPLSADASNWSKALAKAASSGEHSHGEEEASKIDLFSGIRGCRHRKPPIQRLAAVVLDPWITTHRATRATVTVRDGGFSFMTHELTGRNGCGAALLC